VSLVATALDGGKLSRTQIQSRADLVSFVLGVAEGGQSFYSGRVLFAITNMNGVSSERVELTAKCSQCRIPRQEQVKEYDRFVRA
jgi:hypothetical protein